MEKERVFVVVLGKDQKGIIAQVSGLLFQHGANIEDVQQKVMDGTFVMTMLVDISESASGSAGLRKALDELAESLGLKVMLHNEAVIKAMHRI
ncbi:MAG: ACT domain-containing protein [Desulfarculaceae bacterium]|nr:ACT domain-containing protein [Desulfarculaceae bacterium]MCF8048752.1 ACT domain-containing protein [Desulfarculaceae bacterium]MCF8064896.1 ACT domain-containing protein [Desulfarculaceae bacterium]MCF8098858.1 ACT domain-containing protein [Desulfarculaceae bacterium]MCF8122890.1 ACT domain-containing protein [Desulfarculaceae bacterium]